VKLTLFKFPLVAGNIAIGTYMLKYGWLAFRSGDEMSLVVGAALAAAFGFAGALVILLHNVKGDDDGSGPDGYV